MHSIVVIESMARLPWSWFLERTGDSQNSSSLSSLHITFLVSITRTMNPEKTPNNRKPIKGKGVDVDSFRKIRDERQVQIRKDKRIERVNIERRKCRVEVETNEVEMNAIVYTDSASRSNSSSSSIGVGNSSGSFTRMNSNVLVQQRIRKESCCYNSTRNHDLSLDARC